MDFGLIAVSVVFAVAVFWAFRAAARRGASRATTSASVGFGGAGTADGSGGGGGCS